MESFQNGSTSYSGELVHIRIFHVFSGAIQSLALLVPDLVKPPSQLAGVVRMVGLLVMPMVVAVSRLATARAQAVALVELELYLLAGWFPQAELVVSAEVAPPVEGVRLLAGVMVAPVGAAGLRAGRLR